MQTALYEISYKDGRFYRVFCANKTQVQKFLREYNRLKSKGLVKELKAVTHGIHTTKEFLDLISINH